MFLKFTFTCFVPVKVLEDVCDLDSGGEQEVQSDDEPESPLLTPDIPSASKTNSKSSVAATAPVSTLDVDKPSSPVPVNHSGKLKVIPCSTKLSPATFSFFESDVLWIIY